MVFVVSLKITVGMEEKSDTHTVFARDLIRIIFNYILKFRGHDRFMVKCERPRACTIAREHTAHS